MTAGQDQTAFSARAVVGGETAASPTLGDRARHTKSLDYEHRAAGRIGRSVTSAARLRRPVPLLMESALGSRIIDADSNEYIDYVMAFGPALLGHSHPAVRDAVTAQLDRGALFGASHSGELELAERVTSMLPSADQVAFSSTGSDAVFLASRLARSATGRPLILKFEGHYHGWIDPLFVNVPGTPPQRGTHLEVIHGVAGLRPPAGVVVTRWNDLDALAAVMRDHGRDIALVMMEAVPCNFGTFNAGPGYLSGVRRLCDEHGCLLGFDEVITGFRLSPGGAQGTGAVSPDLTILGKALGGGLPIGMVAGQQRVMSVTGTEGSVRVQGTANGAALSVAAANAVLKEIAEIGTDLYAQMETLAQQLAAGIHELARSAGAPLVVNQVGSVLQLWWAPAGCAQTYEEVFEAAPAPVADLALELLSQGVHVLERGLWFLSAAHSEDDIERTLAAMSRVLPKVAAQHL